MLLAGGLVIATVALHVRDPHAPGSWAFCPWFLLTGTYCPGCGGLRAVSDLTHADLAAALSSNALFVTSLPLLAAVWLRSVVRRWQGPPRPLPPRLVVAATVVGCAAALTFAVARNLPVAGYLAP